MGAQEWPRAKFLEVLRELGPALLGSLRNYLQAQSLPGQERFPLRRQVSLTLTAGEGPAEGGVLAEARELGRSGMTLVLPAPLASERVYLWLTSSGAPEPVPVPALVLQSRPVAGDRHEVEVAFG